MAGEKTNWLGLLLKVAVVVLVLGCLTLLLLPTHGHRRGSRCASNLKQIGYALHLYSFDYKENFPERLPVLFEKRYLKDRKVFICRTARDQVVRFTPGDTFTEEHISYCYASGTRADDQPWFIAAFDVESNHSKHRGVNVLFVGGNVGWRSDLDELHDLLGKQRLEMAARGRTMKIIRPAWSEAPPDGLSRR